MKKKRFVRITVSDLKLLLDQAEDDDLDAPIARAFNRALVTLGEKPRYVDGNGKYV